MSVKRCAFVRKKAGAGNPGGSVAEDKCNAVLTSSIAR